MVSKTFSRHSNLLLRGNNAWLTSGKTLSLSGVDYRVHGREWTHTSYTYLFFVLNREIKHGKDTIT